MSMRLVSGGTYNGIMQLSYLGAGPRGDHSHDNVLDNYLGVYSYKPKTSFCVSESANTAYTNFDWRPNMDHAESPQSQLMMITLPHHVSINSISRVVHPIKAAMTQRPSGVKFFF